MKEITDKDRLDFLQEITGNYTGRVVCRRSATGRGWRLHESGKSNAVTSVRDAIDNAIRAYQKQTQGG